MNPSATPQQLTIGAVLAALSPDFPDITISKIRFLEAEGLVTPERTGSGYRTFSPDDLERLRYILTAQRDRFWPLKVIAEALDKLDRGLEPVYNDQTPAHPQVPAGPGDPTCPQPQSLGGAITSGSPTPSCARLPAWTSSRSRPCPRSACCTPTPVAITATRR